MPKGIKTCTQCKKEVGARTQTCSCGHSFANQNNKPALTKAQKDWIGIGAWINSRPPDLPKVTIPPELPRGTKLTVGQVSHYISYEGLGYCIFAYISPNKILDEKLADMWKKTKEQMIEIVHYVAEHEYEAPEDCTC